MLLISDANIFIDMEEGGLIDKLFQLQEQFAVPDILFMEELLEYHADLPAKGLLIKELKDTTIINVYHLRKIYKHPSQNDLFALALALQEKCPLITGDKRLRDVAKAENVELKGTLWIVQRMFEDKLITKNQAKDAYNNMREANRRLPWDQVDAQLKRFRK